MKAIICELCGSNDFVKQDGLFVCGHCGTKYTLDEARKLMSDSEEVVTVKVDQTNQIKNSLQIARNACKSSNYQEAELYANRILEMDPSCAEAWEIKGIAAGWSSTLGNIRFRESIECWTKAVETSKEDEIEPLKARIGKEMAELVVALVATSANSFSSMPTESSYNQLVDCSKIFDLVIAYTLKFGTYGFEPEYIYEKSANLMREASCKGYVMANKAYGPEKSDKNKFAYTTYLERLGYCTNVLEYAIIMAQEEQTVKTIVSDACTYLNSFKHSVCYKYEYNSTLGSSDYVLDCFVSSEGKRIKDEEIAAWKTKEQKHLERIFKEKEEKHNKEVECYWNEHSEEKDILTNAKEELLSEITKDSDLARVIDAQNVVAEIDNLLSDNNSLGVQNLLDEINSKGIINSRYEKMYAELEKGVSANSSSEYLKMAEYKLGLFGDYKESKMLLQKCREYMPSVKEHEQKIAESINRINSLFSEMSSTEDLNRLTSLRGDIIAENNKYCPFNKNEIVQKTDARIKDVEAKLKKKKKKRLTLIIVLVLLFVSLFIFIIRPCIVTLMIKTNVKNGKLDKAFNLANQSFIEDDFYYKWNMYSFGRDCLEEGFVYAKKYNRSNITHAIGAFEKAGQNYKNSGRYIMYCEALLLLDEGDFSYKEFNQALGTADRDITEAKELREEFLKVTQNYNSRIYESRSDDYSIRIESEGHVKFKYNREWDLRFDYAEKQGFLLEGINSETGYNTYDYIPENDCFSYEYDGIVIYERSR